MPSSEDEMTQDQDGPQSRDRSPRERRGVWAAGPRTEDARGAHAELGDVAASLGRRRRGRQETPSPRARFHACTPRNGENIPFFPPAHFAVPCYGNPEKLTWRPRASRTSDTMSDFVSDEEMVLRYPQTEFIFMELI